MPIKTLDEYLKQATTRTTTKQQTTTPEYRIVGFYKETFFQQTPIGKIPKEWQIVKLKELFEFQRGFSYRKKDLSETPTTTRFITINDMEKEGGRKRNAPPVYLKEEIKVNNNFLLKRGDLLIANTDMSKGFIIGAPLYIDDALIQQGRTLVYSMDLTKLIPKRNVHTKFFFYLLTWNPIRKIMKSFAQGTNVLHLNHDLAKNLNIFMPPLEEQWGIAEVLSSVDRAIEATEKLIEKLERLKRGLMQELLTKGIGHKEYKQSSIGKIPKEWQVVKLKDVATVRGNKALKGLKIRKIAFIPMELISEHNIFVNFIMKDINEIRSYTYCRAGDILLAKITPCFENGKQGIVPLDVPQGVALATTEVFPISPHTNIIDRFFLFYLLKCDKYRKILEYRMTGTTGRRRVPRNALENLKIPLPPLEEQKKITNILMRIDRWIQLEKKRKEKLERLKKGLMNLLLTGRVRVKVVKQGVSIGSSSR